MKKLFIAASALFLIVGASQAQTTTTQDKTATAKHHRGAFSHQGGMMKNLNLTEDQKTQFKTMNEDFRKQATALRNDKSLSADELKAKTVALRKDHFTKMQSMLTAEQKAQLAAQRKDGAANGQGRWSGRKGQGMRGDRGKGIEQMKAKLGLTDDQAAKLQANRKDFHSKVQAIRSNSALTDEQKKEQVKALAKDQHESMKSILTPEQLTKMREGRKGKFGSR